MTLEVCEGAGNKTTLGIQVLIGHPDALSAKLWQDLLLLELYINTFSQYDGNEQIGDGFWLPTMRTDFTNEDPLQIAIHIVHEPDVRLSHDKERSSDLLRVVADVHERASVDITDRLWSVLVRCSTYGMLVDCLNAFLTEVAFNRGTVYIAEGNMSWMAGLLRGIIAGVLAVPTFTGTQPLQLLILLGIEKLRKDYVHIFNCANVADEQKINSYFKHDCEEEISGKTGNLRKGVVLRETKLIQISKVAHAMAVLGRLETLCELLCLVPEHWLRYVGETALRQFLGPDSPVGCFGDLAVRQLHEMNTELPQQAVQQHVGLCMPVRHTYTLESKTPGLDLTSTLQLTLRPVFPPCLVSAVSHETTTDVKNVCYHYTSMFKITNYIGK